MAKRPQQLLSRAKIREFIMKDYKEVAEIWEKVGLAAKSESTKDVFIEQQKVAKDLFLVYEIDKKVVGTVIGGWDGWRAWIYRIAVDPKHQRNGIASKLIAEVTRRLSAKGGKKFRALIVSDNTASKSMFKSLGFSIHENILMVAKNGDCC
ncbi:MAG: GNAT family N-acetyltransferase [Thaumarchaeota archaeon]|nr:GNAT family N-acetyltransferase [Nitrososphaerota archaeon]